MEYDGSSREDEESDHVDITLLINSKGVSFVPVPAEDKDGNERVEDEDEDENEDFWSFSILCYVWAKPQDPVGCPPKVS